MPGAYVFEGGLEGGALEEVFRGLSERHEILRTVFREGEAGEVRQVVLTRRELGFKLDQQDLRGQTNQEENYWAAGGGVLWATLCV